MPIYAYKCESCGHAKDVLQKMSDAQLVDCPACGAPTFKKQLTSAGFQLKGSGWYVTDFRDGKGGGKSDAKSDGKTDSKSEGEGAKESGGAEKSEASAAPADSSATTTKSESTTPKTATAPAPVPSSVASPSPAPKSTT